MLKKMQGSFKNNSASFALIFSKLVSGAFLGLVLALVVKTLFDAGSFGFILVIVVTAGAFMKMAGKWKFTGVLLFDLFCLMTALMLRMYIYLAPGT